MVFKVVSGVDKRIWQTYNSGDTSAELVTAALDVTNEHRDHYKNRVVLNWGNFNPSQVREISHGTYFKLSINKKDLTILIDECKNCDLCS